MTYMHLCGKAFTKRKENTTLKTGISSGNMSDLKNVS